MDLWEELVEKEVWEELQKSAGHRNYRTETSLRQPWVPRVVLRAGASSNTTTDSELPIRAQHSATVDNGPGKTAVEAACVMLIMSSW